MTRRSARAPLAFALVIGAMLCGVGQVAAAVRIIGPDEVLKRYCRAEGDRFWLIVPGVAPQELVTRVDDPVIANRGDGSFHPVDPKFVADAIGGMRFPVDQVDAVVYVLPYPRRAGLESAAGPGAIFLAPGVRPVAEAQVHATVAHEFGHVVQYQLATGGSRAWAAYLELRGLPTAGRDTDALAHADNPREIFAEDFRSLCGSLLASANGTIENAAMASPQQVEGLADFFLDLPDRARRTATAEHSVAVYPNPFRMATTVQFTPRAGAALSTAAPARILRILDVRGRIVRHESVPALGDGSATWRWDGSDDHGVRLAPGTYFLAIEGRTADGNPGGAARIVITR
ncbi:MAG: FlgD immunoglobulin-like domain containing protein [Candidatus Eisenbacteria bacterium]